MTRGRYTANNTIHDLENLPGSVRVKPAVIYRGKKYGKLLSRIPCIFFLLVMFASCSSDGYYTALPGNWEYRTGFEESWLKNDTDANITDAKNAGAEWKELGQDMDVRDSIKPGTIITLRKKLPAPAAEALDRNETVFIHAKYAGIGTRFFLDTRFLGLVSRADIMDNGGLPGFIRSLPFPSGDHPAAEYIYAVYTPDEMSSSNRNQPVLPEVHVGNFRSIILLIFNNLNFSLAIFSLFLLMGSYYLTLGIQIPNKQQYFHIGIYCAVSAFLGLFYFRLSGFLFPSGQAPGNGLFYLVFFLKEPFFLLFFLNFYKIKMNRLFAAWIILCGILALIPVILHTSLSRYIIYPGYLVWLIMNGYLLAVSTGRIRKKAGESIFIAAGIIMQVLCSIYLIFSYEGLISKNPLFTVIQFISLSAFSLALTSRFVRVNARVEGMNIELEKRVEEKTKNLEETHSRFIEIAHSAGMAEVATSILHNLGNVLNSIYVSSEEIIETLNDSKLAMLIEANKLLDEHRNNLQDFLLNDPKAPLIFDYFRKVGDQLKTEHENVTGEARQLIRDITMIKEIIDTQQEYAKQELPGNELNLLDIVEDALKMQHNELEQSRVTIDKKYLETPNIKGQKSKIIHILINLFKNAMTAMQQNDPGGRILTIGIGQNGKHNVHVTISDNGSGISRENLNKLFSYGFTTKKDGHGFGLHICASMMRAMGGSIEAESRGEGKGAVFTLTFPLEQQEIEDDDEKKESL